ncbi:MAG TPA: cupredoxin domain-containing protein [Actinomycetota bacterium]|nr:cupredoxin domain-containing protein [Actinomycetota bacterium]
MRDTLRGVRLAGLALSLVLLLAACGSSSSDGGDGGGGGGGAGGGDGAAGLTITIKDLAFHPNTLSAPGGQQSTVTITNEDSVTHSFTLDDGAVSRDVPAGQTVEVTVPFPASATAGFHCKFHPSMTGTLRAA